MERERGLAAVQEIAIIGMACRFPGARDYEEFWENLIEGRSSIQEIPKNRWDWKAYWGDPQTEKNKSNSRWGGFIDDVDAFDPGFFGLSAREVEATDPQQRIMLELTWSCLEDAGVRPSRISGDKVGVYIGVFNFDYKGLQERKERTIETYHSIGTASAVIANRISHYFDFKGPSFPIDTACSSSFNAIHSAAQSLLLGECEMALAGGISLILTPSRHISFSKAGMLSPTGSCKTFDDSADGYVRSEGAGVVLLKPLAKALEDGDPICGILKGSAVNHNGKTHTLTYPNPDAQAEVIAEAHRRAGVPVESISYIEAHGTGTPKGDPMEFRGLVKAFELLGSPEVREEKKNYCGLGSVKTNIGHLESAAGIAGLIKVLLSMKHKRLPGLQNFNKLNHRISIEDSPFYIVDNAREWEQLQGKDNQPVPRRAGISSFGFGGTNAHVVVEEAPAVEAASGKELPGYIICLSAKTEEALRQRERDLALWLDRRGAEYELADISAALLLGRDHFGARAAFVVKDLRELREKLSQVLEKGQTEGYFKDRLPLKTAQDQPLFEQLSKLLMSELLANREIGAEEYGSKLKALAELYVKGYEADWRALFPFDRLRHVHLPTYPFARERYWISEEDEGDVHRAAEYGNASSFIHPLLHSNTSDFSEQRYSSTFTGAEFFLADHVVKGRRVLPGVAYLEMARAAVEKAAGLTDKISSRMCLKNVVWARPIAVENEPVEVHIGLFPEDSGDIFYEIYSKADKNEDPAIHSQGSAVFRPTDEPPKVNIQDLKARHTESTLSAAQYYEAFRSSGLDYGPSHRGIEAVYADAGRLLAKLILPVPIRDSRDPYMLHPSLMDSALQAAIILMDGPDIAESSSTPEGRSAGRLYLPYALQELEIFHPCTAAMWAFIQYHNGGSGRGTAEKLDIDLMDEQGTICARMKGLSWRAVDDDTAVTKMRTNAETVLLHPFWKVQNVSSEAVPAVYDEHLVVLCEMDDAAGRLEGLMDGARILSLKPEQDRIQERFQTYAAKLLEEVQRLLIDSSKGRVFVQIVTQMQEEQEQLLLGGLSGLLQTAQLENPKFTGQMIGVEPDEGPEGLADKLKENARSPEDSRIKYQDGTRRVLGWGKLEDSAAEESVPWKDGGVYLITGGAGGLGLLFAKEIAGQAKDVSLILTGRSPYSSEKQAHLDEIMTLGARAVYKQADVTNDKEVNDFIQSISDDFGGLDGIIHSAGVIRDSFILNKTARELQEVLDPKVAGAVNLDRATKDMSLDFFILFSSVFGAIGNPGQADYCSANAFMDAYAAYRNSLMRAGRRKGRTLSVNWPLWKDGGMRVDPETEKMMRQNLGMAAMDAGTGMRAFYQALTSGKEQVLVAEGDLSLFLANLTRKQAIEAVSFSYAEYDGSSQGTMPTVSADDTAAFAEQAANYLKKLISGVLKLPVQRIDTDAPMENYGIDSIMTMQLTNELEKTFGSLSKTLFFEYQNIRELTGYFLKDYRDKMMQLLGAEQKAAEAPVPNPETSISDAKPTIPVMTGRKRSRFASVNLKERKEQTAGTSDIAIIGVSGRYPGAGSMREFWDVLRNGRDCITEIPADRWDYRLYFDEDRNKPGKSYGKWGGFVDGVDRFDPLFFNISPKEAEIMDPQERLFLQCVYETIEDAGYTRETLAKHNKFGIDGNVGVYVGVMYEEYQLYGAQQQMAGKPVALFGLPASIANRVSYFCNFHGPSMAVDTMCSSSLTAIHLACHSLQRGECEVAVAGGVNVSIHPNKYLFLSQGKFISGKGRCESFGQGGDGYVPGEGVGAVLLKPLSQAIADKDNIYGIIKATAINHGGKTNGYTVPNPHAQAGVIGRAFEEAGIDPRTISYLEAHGTGTSLGDPIEIAGLNNVFRQYTKDKQFCSIGSVKSNIGHCESAAGIAGLTKVLLQLKYRQLVPSLHSRVLNPNIDFTDSPFVVQQELSEWKRPVLEINGEWREYPRIAGISSFGAGGSNAHLVIEEFISQDAGTRQIAVGSQNPAIIVLSAKSEEQLKEQAHRLLIAIGERQFGDPALADIAYTLQLGREAMEERLALIVSTMTELEDQLKAVIQEQGRLENHQIDGLYYGQVKRNKEIMAALGKDEELQEAIGKWMLRKKYAKLASLWVKGLNVDWSMLYGEIKPRRVSLPAYPFAAERYWVPGFDAAPGGIAPETGTGTMPVLMEERPVQRRTCFVTKQWELSDAVSTKPVTGTVAILADEETMQLAFRVSGHLAGSRIIDIGDLTRELGQAAHEWEHYEGCIDLVGCGSGKAMPADWIVWLQRLVEHSRKGILTLLNVTKGLESFGSSAVRLSGAERAGLYRMLQSEYRRLVTRHMDVDFTSEDSVLVEQIASEFAADSRDAEVCYRNGKRYRAYLSERREEDTGTEPFVFPEDHVLWITGGTRGIGYVCAEHFVKRYGVRKLVLTGREKLPPREQWGQYKEQNTAVSRKIRAIQALEEQNAEVIVLSADLTDEQGLRDCVEDVGRTMGPAGGVIHCAGAIDLDNPAFIRKSVNGIEQVLEPKIAGLNALYRSFRGEPVTFFALFSSVSSIIPALASGQSDYCMANAYMDYFAEAEAGACPIVSIQWPSWKETGMGEVRSSAYEQTGLLSLTNEEALRLLDRILSSRMGPVVMPAVVNPDLWNPGILMQRADRGTRQADGRQPKPVKHAALGGSLLNRTQAWLLELLAEELKIDVSRLEIDTAFQDYGVDSIMLAQLLRKINSRLTEELEPTVLFEYPSVETLAAWLVRTHSGKLAGVLETADDRTSGGVTVMDAVSEEPAGFPEHRVSIQEGNNGGAKGVSPSGIAVVGMSCRFPGADSLDEYWRILSEGRSAIGPVPFERWGYSNRYYAGLLNEISSFDPAFFLIPDADAKAMDPQALLVLEESLGLLCHAGYSQQEIKGKAVGVYIGARSRHQPEEATLHHARNPIVAVGQNYLAANISQFYDLRGPSVVVDTACSSALVGMNMAIQALNAGDIEAAIVGGAGLLTTDDAHRIFEQRGILNAGQNFHLFDGRAGGVVLGEGAGMVLLKTVKQAIADGDRIYAVIKGLAVNNDGRTAGPATPNIQAQKEVLQTALRKSGRKPEEISYVETNGSGTIVTDLLELKAIQSVYRASGSALLGLGSMKPNIGHPLCAEGIASFIKVVLMMQHKRMVPFLSGDVPMSHFDMKNAPFYFSREHTEWTETPRIAAINCFADGGTNAHVILEEWADADQGRAVRPPLPLPLLNRKRIFDNGAKSEPAKEMVWETFG